MTETKKQAKKWHAPTLAVHGTVQELTQVNKLKTPGLQDDFCVGISTVH